MKEQHGEVIHRQSNLVSWDIYVILFNESASALTDLTDFETLRPAVCMWGLMCQRGGLKSSPCSATGTRQSPQANISWHFPWQHAMISALSTTVGEGMIAKLPSKTIPPPDKIHLCDACQCVCSCVLLCLSGTWNFKSIFDTLLKDWTPHWIFIANNSLQMCFARWNSTLMSPPQSIFVQISIVRRGCSSYIHLDSTLKQFTHNLKDLGPWFTWLWFPAFY